MTHRLLLVLLRPKYFHSVFTHSTYGLLSPADLPAVETVLSTINTSTLDVFQVLCNLKPSKASDIDSIIPALLKYCAGSLTTPDPLIKSQISITKRVDLTIAMNKRFSTI